MYRQARRTNPIEDFGRNGHTPVPRFSFIGDIEYSEMWAMGYLETDLAPATLRCQRLRNCQRARRFFSLGPQDIVFPIKSIVDFNDAGRNSGHKVRSCLWSRLLRRLFFAWRELP